MSSLEWDTTGYSSSAVRENVSYTLGVISIMCWIFAEIPQIKTNYRTKSASSLHLGFLISWLIGDIFNVLGCHLEPDTLVTQLITAYGYTLATLVLTAQKVYYDHLRIRWQCDREEISVNESSETDVNQKLIEDKCEYKESANANLHQLTTPIPVNSQGLYYMSARSFSSSPIPTGSFLARSNNIGQSPRDTTHQISVNDPLLEDHASSKTSLPANLKNMLCVASSSIFFLGSTGLYLTGEIDRSPNGVVMLVGRKLLADEYNQSLLKYDNNNQIGFALGCAMTVIYISGRFLQISLNNRREDNTGLDPFMFIFALLGNGTYIASILFRSFEWSSVFSNLPWLVDAAFCIILDVFLDSALSHVKCERPYRTLKIVIQLKVLPKIKQMKREEQDL